MFGSRNFLLAKGSAYKFRTIPSGTLFAWGNNAFGMRGTGVYGPGSYEPKFSSPTQVGSLTTWALPSAGSNHSMWTKSDGTLWGSGYNGAGNLGDGTQTNRSSPVQVGSLTDWARVTSAGRFTSCIKTDGTLWTWGYNSDGQLGLNNTTTTFISPVQVGALKTWKIPEAGTTFMLCLRQDGSLFSWGDNTHGQLGLGNAVKRSSPTQVGALTTWKKPSVSSAGYNSLCTREDGTLWAWGRNVDGSLGLGDTVSRSSPVQVGSLTNWFIPNAAGDFSLCVKTDGTLWSWGSNSSGKLGLGDTYNRSSPVQVGALTNWARPGNFGPNSSACVKNDGTLWTWGQNADGALGIGNVNSRSSPVQVGALTSWGYPVASGRPTAFCTRATPTLVPTNLILPIVTGTTEEGQILTSTTGMWEDLPTSFTFQWQRGTSNISGATSSTYTIVTADVGSTLRCVVTATNGIGSASATSANTSTATAYAVYLFAWGTNNNGALGLGDRNVARSSPTQVGSLNTWLTPTDAAVDSFCTKLDGTLWALGGQNNQGQLGLGNTNYVSSPTQIGSSTNWRLAGCGRDFATAVKTEGTLWSWGYNSNGQLGKDDTISRSSPVQIGALTDWRTPAKGAGPGVNHMLCTKTDGTLWAWGNNGAGKLGLGGTISRSSPTQVGSATNWAIPSHNGNNSLCTRTDGTLYVWGQNTKGQLGLNNVTTFNTPQQVTGTNWATATAGRLFTMCTTSDGKLFAWGYNSHGQLGLGDIIDRSSPVQVGALTNWATPSAGSYTAGCIKTDGTLWMWGSGDQGALGQNNAVSRSSPVQIGSSTNWRKLSVNGYSSVHNFVHATRT